MMMKKVTIVGLLIVLAVGLSGFIPKQEVSNITAMHRVEEGETVWGIAERNFDRQNKYSDLNEFVFVIRQKNNLLGNKVLQVGRVIAIPLVVEK